MRKADVVLILSNMGIQVIFFPKISFCITIEFSYLYKNSTAPLRLLIQETSTYLQTIKLLCKSNSAGRVLLCPLGQPRAPQLGQAL